jgi:apolipoprotein D and lipocalin family protein
VADDTLRGEALEARILAAEMRVIEGDQRLQLDLQNWGRQTTQVFAPRRLLSSATGPLALGLVALAGFFGWRRRGGAAQQAAPPVGHAPQHAQAGGAADLVLRLLPMAWPLLPARWRARVSPAAASTLLGLALPVLGGLLASRPSRPPPPTVPFVDLGRLSGRWYEVGRLPARAEGACEDLPQIHFALEGGVVQVTSSCAADGGRRLVSGIATVEPSSGNARLQMSFLPDWLRWLPLAWAPYWIFHLDESADDYRVALAGNPSGRALWLLSREPFLPAAEVAGLVSIAANLGFEVDKLKVARR